MNVCLHMIQKNNVYFELRWFDTKMISWFTQFILILITNII